MVGDPLVKEADRYISHRHGAGYHMHGPREGGLDHSHQEGDPPLRPYRVADMARQALGALRQRGEVRVTDPDTGGQKGMKACQVGALDPVALEQVGLVAGYGTHKYDRYNFLKGYAWSLSVDALFRHLVSFLMGEDLDPESGLPHTAHAAWHAMALTSFLVRDIGKDDRAPN
jgi:hypothetical protein